MAPSTRAFRPVRLRRATPPAAETTARPSLDLEPAPNRPALRRVATNFVALSAAEIACRGVAMAVTLLLASRLGPENNGRIALAFNVVFWLVLLVRDGLEVMAAREIARHPRMIRPLVDHLLALKGCLALGLYAGLLAVVFVALDAPRERSVFALYGLLLITTALGLDFVYRGSERMGLVAVSLVLRTLVYAGGVVVVVRDASWIVGVPALLVAGEVSGIALVWFCYVREHGWPRPSLGRSRFVAVAVRRGLPVLLIQVAQAVLGSVDALVIGLMSGWGEVGLYDAPHRVAMAALAFSLIFQQVVFPGLARSWRDSPGSVRNALDGMVRVLMIGLVPMAVGATVLAGPIVRTLLDSPYAGAAPLLAVGIWRAPLLAVAFLYQTALIALNREVVGVRLLLVGAALSAPLVAFLCGNFGLIGGSSAVLVIGGVLVAAGYGLLAREGRQPAWHHHLLRPALASLAMVPACRIAVDRGMPLALTVAAGAGAYLIALITLGGLRREDLRLVVGCPCGSGGGNS